MKKMKKSFIYLAFSLLLTGCSNGTEKDATKLPNKGTEITVSEGKNQRKQAYCVDATPKETKEDDALGVSFKDLSFGASLNLSRTGDRPASLTAKADLSDANREFARKGLTSSSTADLERYARAKAKLAYEFKLTGSFITESGLVKGTTSTTESKDTANLSASVYADHDYIYTDSSERDLGNLESLFNIQIEKGKYRTSSPFSALTDDNRPLLSVDESDDSSSVFYYDRLEDFRMDRTDKGVFKSHGKDVYSYSYALTAKDIEEEIQDALEDFEQGIGSWRNQTTEIPSLRNCIDVDDSSSIQFAAVFSSKTGFQSIGASSNFKVKIDTTPISDKLSSYGVSKTTTVQGERSEHSSFKREFSRGKDVVIPSIDKSSYLVDQVK